MKKSILLLALLFSPAWADIVKLKDGETIRGTVLKQTDTEVMPKVGYTILTLSRDEIESIEKTEEKDDSPAPQGRIPSWKTCVGVIFGQDWIKTFLQIPATVIDKGVLRRVPYKSFRSGDYEFNLYGDPDQPACIEVGVYRELLKDPEAKRRCVGLMLALFKQEADRRVLESLDLAKDKKQHEGLTFEVTPHTAPDAYGGWWISVYDEKALDGQRASDRELEAITVVKAEKPKEDKPKVEPAPQPQPKPAPRTADPPRPRPYRTEWTWNDYAYARFIQSQMRHYVRDHCRQNGSYSRYAPPGGPKR